MRSSAFGGVGASNGCVSFECSVDEPQMELGRCSNGYVSFVLKLYLSDLTEYY